MGAGDFAEAPCAAVLALAVLLMLDEEASASGVACSTSTAIPGSLAAREDLREKEGRYTDARLPETRNPAAPTREGPMIVVVYLRPEAPG